MPGVIGTLSCVAYGGDLSQAAVVRINKCEVAIVRIMHPYLSML